MPTPLRLSGWNRHQEEPTAMATVDYVHHVAFPKLSEDEIESVAGLGKVCSFKDGETIFQAWASRSAVLRRGVGWDCNRG